MRNLLRVLFAVALALMSLAGVGGAAVSAAGTGSIVGGVFIDGTTTPLDGAGGRPVATVTVYDSSWRWVGVDLMGGGSYSVGGLGTGDYYVTAVADGYLREWYDNATVQSLAIGVHVEDGSATINKDFYLAPGKSIRGTVYDNATQPIEDARVEIVDNVTSSTTYGFAYSADNGSYSIAVAPGTYKVRAFAPGHTTEYYDNVTSFASATPVELATDNDTAGIDFSLGTVGSIVGQVFQADNVTPIVGVRVTAYNSSGGVVTYGDSSNDNGTYYINLANGDYRIVATGTGYVPQWWNDHQLASEPADPGPSWAVGDWVTVADNQTPGHDFRMLPKQAVATGAASGWTTSTATLNGSLTSLGASTTVNVSFQWGTDNTYAGGTTAAQAMTAAGPFSASLTGLAPNTMYHFRAVAVGGLTTYGGDSSFTTTSVGVPVVTTDAESVVTTTSATLNGNLTDLGTAENVTVSFEWGATTAYGSTTTGVSENATGAFEASLTGLTPNTNYHFRAVAVGDGAPAYGADRSFTTLGTVPVVTTDNATSVGAASATLKGALTSLGTEASVNVSFEWKVAGGSWVETTVQTLTAAGAFTANLTGLTDGTAYVFRAKADGYGAPVYGAENTFTTTAVDRTGPVISSLGSSDETSSAATINWTTNEAATSRVEYGLTDEYGEATDEDTNLVTSHSVELTGLEAGKTYYYRVVSKDAANNVTMSEGMTLETEGSGGGVPVWGWVLIGLALVGVVGGGAAMLLKGKRPPPA